MKRYLSFAPTPGVEEALEQAVAALRARHPGQTVSRSDAVRVAILSLAASLQRVANPLPTSVVGEAVR